jgi:hypothetical protein
MGEPELATREKGECVYREAVMQLGRIVEFFQARPKDVRERHQETAPTMPIPWGQLDAVE